MTKYSLWWKTPPPTIQVLYGDAVVAELKREKMGSQRMYHFTYLPRFTDMHLAPLPGLPIEKRDHWSETLWAFFAERIPDLRRPEIQATLKARKINQYDEWQLLSELGTKSVTDSFELRSTAA